ncbi:MerR family transcriptional regulator [Nocardia carnea]|uniref:MerR family transcriptional regulator n=1 Tax=Nocardia carnea TaxID=37328 RepID=UPI00245482FC|nr:MerR family transcriptional regulator [Nocardia carnea]
MLSIGDFARHGQVSVRMLRHYDLLGLLVPDRVDPVSGYRYYEVGQLARLNRIIALKELGFTLDQVGRMLDGAVTGAELRGMLTLRSAELAQRIAADRERLARVEARLRVIEREGTMPTDEIVVKSVPAVRIAERSTLVADFTPERIGPAVQRLFTELCAALERDRVEISGPAVCYYDHRPDGSVLAHAGMPVRTEPGGSDDFTVVDLPEMPLAATQIYRGDMNGVVEPHQDLVQWIADNGYRTAGPGREVTLVWDVDNSKWVTELQEPIARA